MQAVKPLWQLVKRHPVSIIFYSLYTAWCALVFIANIRYNQWLAVNPGRHGVSYGEGIMYGILFLIMIGSLFVFVLLINAIVRKQSAFYLWLSLVVVVQAVAAIATV